MLHNTSQGRSLTYVRVGFPPALRMCVTTRACVYNYTCACVYARLRTGRCQQRGWPYGYDNVAAAGGYGYSGRRSRGFGRHSALRRLIVMYLLVAATGATVPLSLSTLITGSLRYKAERGQALHLSPRSAARAHRHAALRPSLLFGDQGDFRAT